MNIALIGPSGMIGQRILEEALARDHQVVALVREPGSVKTTNPKLTQTPADIFDPASVAAAVTGSEVLISAFGPGNAGAEQLVAAAKSLLAVLRIRPAIRLVVVGGAGSLEVAPGKQLVDTPDFPPAWKALALAQREALVVYRAADPGLQWTCICPPAFIQPGERTGKYRTGTDQLVVDKNGESRISAEDFAVAILDEVERPKFTRKRFTVAY